MESTYIARMTKSLTVVALTVIAISAHAETTEGNLYRFSEFSRSTENRPLQPALDASVKIRLDSQYVYLGHETPGTCSGTFVSNEGHLLTALHCVPTCLLLQNAMQVKLAPEGFVFRDVDAKTAIGIKCKLYVNERLRDATVVAVGNGSAAPYGGTKASLPKMLDGLAKAYANGYGASYDWILFKVDTGNETIRCTQTNLSDSPSLLPETKVAALGAPSPTFFKTGINAEDDLDFRASRGRICKDLRIPQLDELAKTRNFTAMSSPLQSSRKELGEALFLRAISVTGNVGPNVFKHSSVIYHASSGGGVFDENSQLIGVSVSMDQEIYAGRDVQHEFTPCAYGALKTERIYQMAKAQVGASAAASFFACKR